MGGSGVPKEGGKEKENLPAVSFPEMGDSEGTVWQAASWSPKDVHIPVPGPCDHVI